MRPLLLDELCEAIQISDTEPGHDLTEDTRIVTDSIIENCAPLVRMETTGANESKPKIVTLCHSSVRTFLEKNPGILQDHETAHTAAIGNIEATLFAELCLKYLQQPRYVRQLKMTKGSFATHCGQDIVEHHLLKYCAKYWGQHLGKLDFSPELGEKVERFLRSDYFVTCIQVQSLLIGGQYCGLAGTMN